MSKQRLHMDGAQHICSAEQQGRIVPSRELRHHRGPSIAYLNLTSAPGRSTAAVRNRKLRKKKVNRRYQQTPVLPLSWRFVPYRSGCAPSAHLLLLARAGSLVQRTL